MASRRIGKQQSDRLHPAVASHLRRQVPKRSCLGAYLMDLYLPHRQLTVVPIELTDDGWGCVTSSLHEGPQQTCFIAELEAVTAVERPATARYVDDLAPTDQLFVWQTHGWMTWPGGSPTQLLAPLSGVTNAETMTVTIDDVVLEHLRKQLASRSSKTVLHLIDLMVAARYLVKQPFTEGKSIEYRLILPADLWSL